MSSDKLLRHSVLCCVVLVAAALLATPALAQGKCQTLAGTIVGSFDVLGSQGPGWYGWAYLTFGRDHNVLAAKLVDVNVDYKAHPSHVKPDGSGNFAGDELLTFEVGSVGSFQMTGHFIGIAGTTPYAYGFSEEGKVVPSAGTGAFNGMTGNISIHGSFVLGPEAEPAADQPWLWIAQMTGSVCK